MCTPRTQPFLGENETCPNPPGGLEFDSTRAKAPRKGDSERTHIDHDDLVLENESDVEQKVILPVLLGPVFLEIPQKSVFTKSYLMPTVLDKNAHATGYYPDYSIWMHGFPIMVVEAKAPDVPCDVGYREASLYARHLNAA